MSPPTDRQLEVLEFMRRYQREHGMPPTAREICVEFNFKSTNAAFQVLVALGKKGLVDHRPMVARGWRALPPTSTGELEFTGEVP